MVVDSTFEQKGSSKKILSAIDLIVISKTKAEFAVATNFRRFHLHLEIQLEVPLVTLVVCQNLYEALQSASY